MSKKRAFTMVELIFVIVILGILAAVAVPKLNASREDAKIAVAVADVRTLLDDIHSYYAAQGSIPRFFDLRELTNVAINPGGITDKFSNAQRDYTYAIDGKTCFVITAHKVDEVLFSVHSSFVSSQVCKKALKKMDFVRGEGLSDPTIITLAQMADAPSDWNPVLIRLNKQSVKFE